MNLNIKNILETCNATLVWGNDEIECKNFSKDTRTINENDVYIGIKGENLDGNTLYIDAFEKGAKVCILQGIDINELKKVEEKYKDRAVIIVENTIEALQKIAEFKRSLYNIPIIAITGSVGKTSTKDIVSSVVGTKYKVQKTQGNLNNHIGLPLTILSLDDHEALVVEMGMNNLGEISLLSKIAKPNIAIITNVGTSHIGNLGSRENILKAKLEILDGMSENGTLIINNDNDLLHSWVENYSGNLNIIKYGIENESNFKAININLKENSSTFEINFNNKLEKIEVPVGGIHFVYNALCATAVGAMLKISIEDINSGIKNFELSKNRMEIINLSNGAKIINDCYNANYDSMKAAINYLSKTENTRKIAVLGDMLELGEFSQELHEKVGAEVIENKIDILITVGELGKIIGNKVLEKNEKVFMFNKNEEAINKIKSIIKNGDIVLIKASNGMKFKEIVEELKKI